MRHDEPKRGEPWSFPLSRRYAWRATVHWRRGIDILQKRRLRHFVSCAAAMRLITRGCSSPSGGDGRPKQANRF
jgi:hypothetical protein